MSKLILIIADSPDDRAVFSRYLEFVGASVQTVGDGEEGLRFAAGRMPNLILLELSGSDAWSLMRRLQFDPRTSVIPVVALASDEVDSDRLEAAGFCGRVSKPVSPYRLLEEVERCLGTLVETSEMAPQERS